MEVMPQEMPQAWFVNLGIKINNLPKVFINLFGFEIYWYAIIICMGIIAGILYAMHEAKRTRQNPDDYIDFFFLGFVMAIIGARLYYVIFNWQLYANDLASIFNLRSGGLAIYGGLLGGIAAAVIFTKRMNINFWLLADTAAPAFILGQAIGRWANFFNREAFGGYTQSLFALRYKAVNVLYIPESVFEKMMNINGVDYIQVHPTFLYESVFNLILFILLNVLKHKKSFDGEIFWAYLLGYGVIRFFIEAMRTDQLMFFSTGIPVSQALSVILALMATIMIVRAKRGIRSI